MLISQSLVNMFRHVERLIMMFIVKRRILFLNLSVDKLFKNFMIKCSEEDISLILFIYSSTASWLCVLRIVRPEMFLNRSLNRSNTALFDFLGPVRMFGRLQRPWEVFWATQNFILIGQYVSVVLDKLWQLGGLVSRGKASAPDSTYFVRNWKIF